MDNVLKQEMTQLKDEVGDINRMVGEIKDALIGNTYAKDGGLVGRIAKAEVKIETLEEEIDKLQTLIQTRDVYVKIMWTLVGMSATALIGFLLSLIFKR
jgi:peptidoglycan hydrolase CwlO-like protein